MTDTRPTNPNAMFHIPGAYANNPQATALNVAPAPVMSPMETPMAAPIREGADPSIDAATRQDQINTLNADYNMPAYEEAPVDYDAERAATIAESAAELEALYAAPAAEEPVVRLETIAPAPTTEQPHEFAKPAIEAAGNWISGPEAAQRAAEYGHRIIQLNRQPVLTQYGESAN